MNKRTNLIFSLLQGIAVAIALLGTAVAFCLAYVGVDSFLLFSSGEKSILSFYAVIGLITVAVVSLFSYGALYQFFRICGRLKHTTAFTAVNEKGMHRIAVCCGVCGIALALALIISFFCNSGFFLPFVELMFLLSGAYLCVALVAYALELLLQRATAIQQENDLTI